MPNPSYRTYCGVRKDSTVTTLSAAAAASATTVVVTSATGITTSSTILIFDGVNSESRAVTNVSSNTLTVAALTYAHSANVYVSAQATASLGPVNYLPVTAIDFHDMVTLLDDKGLRGSLVDSYGQVQGVTKAEVTLGGDVICDTFGYPLGGILGATDFTGGTPNQHDFSVKNTGDCQPTPLVLFDFDVVNTRAVPAAKVTDLTVTYTPDGFLTWTSKATGLASGIVATPTSSFTTVQPTAGWVGICTIGGTAVQILLAADIQMKRTVDVVYTAQGIQSPYKIFLGPLTVTGKLTFVMEDDTQLLNYLNNSQPSLDLLFTTGTGASQTSAQFHMTKASYGDANIKQTGKTFNTLEVPFVGIANTTDATTAGTGYSPIKATLKNAVATGTYQ